jgi:hypothetical protein
MDATARSRPTPAADRPCASRFSTPKSRLAYTLGTIGGGCVLHLAAIHCFERAVRSTSNIVST